MRLFQNRKQEHPQRLSNDSDILTKKQNNNNKTPGILQHYSNSTERNSSKTPPQKIFFSQENEIFWKLGIDGFIILNKIKVNGFMICGSIV